jgi:anti-anti-sigma factor
MKPEKHGRLLIFKLEGDLPVPELLEFKREISKAIETKQAVALDMGAVRSLNSNAIGLFINASLKLKAVGACLYLLAPTPDVYEVMALVSLEEQIPIYLSRADFQKEVLPRHR